jgi:uncharacterized protein (TIGR00730 family)
MPTVTVFCSSSPDIDPRYLTLAGEVGAELARRGHTLVSGGGSVSCMGALARAARAGGARTVGVIPRGLVAREVVDRDADDLVVTDDMRERKGEMDARADGFLALPGGLGTLEELLEIWVARSLGMHDKPVVILDVDGLLDPLRGLVDHLVGAGFVHRQARDEVVWVRSVTGAFDALEAAWAARPARPPAPPVPRVEEVLEAEP